MDNLQKVARNLTAAFGLGLMAFSMLAFSVVWQEGSPWPALAGAASAVASYIWLRVSYLVHTGRL